MPLRTAVGPERARDDFLWAIEGYLDTTLDVPDPLTFAMSPQYLNQYELYPRQGTLLKLVNLRRDLLTDYDYEVIDEWIRMWKESEDEGILPDTLDRMEVCRAEGRPWFRDNLSIIGRRGSKGYMGGIQGAIVLWRYLSRGNPQRYYGLQRDRALGMFCFAAKLDMAASLQWADLSSVILGAPCFEPYLTKRAYTKDLRLYAPNDYLRIADRQERGVAFRPEEMATFHVSPKESTVVAARGPALFSLLMDEMAHVTRQVARASADDVWKTALPALGTFKTDAWIYESSSPSAKTGQFYQNYLEAQRISDGSEDRPKGEAARPDIFVAQLSSFDLYRDWERAHEIPIRPGEPECYQRKRQAVQEFDDQMRREQRADPETFKVERLSKWMSVTDAYFHEERIDAMFAPWPNAANPLNAGATQGSLANDYVMHIDPSKVGDNTGLCIGHAVRVQGDQLPHVVIDVVGHWRPGDFPGHEIDYNAILVEIARLIGQFMPTEVSFDQGSSSGMMIQTLRSLIANSNTPKRITVFERTATLNYNWAVAETTKVAMQLGNLHVPFDDLLRNECLFLQLVNPKKVDHPSSGPVQSKDVFDALSNVVHALIGKDVSRLMGEQFMSAGILGAQPGGLPMPLSPTLSGQGGFETSGMPKRPVAEVAGQMQQFTQSMAKNRLRMGQARGSGIPRQRRR